MTSAAAPSTSSPVRDESPGLSTDLSPNRASAASEDGSEATAILGSADEVVSVVFDPSDDKTPGQAGGPWACVPPPATKSFQSFFGDAESKPVASGHDAGSDELPESLRLLDLVGTDEDPYKEGGAWAYADAEDLGGRVFFITQNEKYLDTDRVLMSVERIEKAVAKKGMTDWAWIKHDQDQYTAEEAEKLPGAVVGQPKADHFHIAIRRKSFATLGQIARAFGVPPNAVEIKPQGAFLDLIEYLTHEHPNQIAKGKHHYDDDEVHASLDWRPALEEHKLARSAKAGQRASLKKRDAIREAVMLGEVTLKQIREDERAIYIQDLEKLQKLRQDFMVHQPAPRHRTNYYIGSPAGAVRKGRTGKTQLAKLVARMLYPDLDADECYHVATDARVPLQNYKGQP